jgi:hypothetical protein
MIWLVWRQHRKQAVFALVTLAALAAFLVPTGIQMHRAYDEARLDDCLRSAKRVELIDPAAGDPVSAQVDACVQRSGRFTERFGSLGLVGGLFWFLPLFAGMFWGAPVVAREIEQGTHRLVWTQGVSRLRWAAVKFGLLAAGVVVVAAGYALLVSWWRAPLDEIGAPFGTRFGYFLFDLEGIVPIGYALFAFALGVFAGVLTGRSLGAMAVTLVGFFVARLTVEFVARPRFLPQLRRAFPVEGNRLRNFLTGDWVVTAGIYDAGGNAVRGGIFGTYSSDLCPPSSTIAGAPPTTVSRCVREYGAGAYNLEMFHPASRYWLFQGIETALFVVLAAVLLLAAVYWVRRRIA